MEKKRNNRNNTKLDVCEIPNVLSIEAKVTATACENAIGKRHLSNNSHVLLSSGSSTTFAGGISQSLLNYIQLLFFFFLNIFIFEL